MNPDQSSAQNPAIDVETLEGLRELMEEEFPVLVQSCLEDTSDLLGKIGDAISNVNSEELMLHAHALKSSSANMGALSVSNNAAELERLGKEGTTENASPPFRQVPRRMRQRSQDPRVGAPGVEPRRPQPSTSGATWAPAPALERLPAQEQAPIPRRFPLLEFAV